MTMTDEVKKHLQDFILPGEVSLVGKNLGDGAYGKVFAVEYRRTTYAAKEIHSILIQCANEQEREVLYANFSQECYYCSKLCHPNIVAFKGIWWPNQRSLPVMIMELMDESLVKYIEKKPQDFNVVIKISILYDVSCGLDYLHGSDPPIIHRDLSSNNILLISRGQKLIAKLSDLGVAKIIKANSKATISKLSKAPGTMDFMPPEALEDNPQYTTALDIFSYAGIVLHVVTQEWPTPTNPVRQKTQSNTLTALSEVERRQKCLDKIRGPAEVLEPLVIACLNNEPVKRPATPTVVKILNFLMENHRTVHDADIVIKSASYGIPNGKYCLVTLASGQSTEKPLAYRLKQPRTKIGRPDAKEQQDIQLKGADIQQEHCIVELHNSEVIIIPLPDADIQVNGKVIQEGTKLYHGCRILLGMSHFFQLICPKQNVARAQKFGSTTGNELYSHAIKEVIINELDRSATSTSENVQLHLDHVSQKIKDRDREVLVKAFLKAKNLIKDVNILVNQKAKKDVVFKVIMQIPARLLSPLAMDEERCHQITGDEIAISVIQKAQRIESIWDIKSFEAKIKALKEETVNVTASSFHVEHPPLLGVANIFMQCMNYCICHEYDAPLIGPTGKVCGTLKLSLERIQATQKELVQGIGSQVKIKITVTEATELSSAYYYNVFCRYKFWNQPESEFASLQASSSSVQSVKLLEELKFDHTQVVEVKVTKDFLDYIKHGTLSVKLYGHHTSIDSCETTNADSLEKSFPDRCYEVKKNLEMWVKLLEAKDPPKYIPVANKNFGTGGIYEIHQGHQLHNIEVKISPVEGSGDSPLQCSHITSIAIGSICYSEESLDSYQEDDLDRLRTKWSSTLTSHIQYAQNKLNRRLTMRGSTGLNNEMGESLTKQWVASNMEQFLLSSSRDGIPGVKTNVKIPPGMEQQIITLYLNLNDDMSTPCDEDPVTAVATASLKGEDDHSMVYLPLLKRSNTALEATATWDFSLHNNDSCLSDCTPNGVRVYAILKVSVMLKHPLDIELVLRKRISLRIIKKIGYFASMKNKLFTALTQTGVTYEVVTGKPKLEGMLHLCNHLSFIKLEENDDVAEKYIKAVMSVCTILTDDRSKQEVSLREKLAANEKSASASLSDIIMTEEAKALKHDFITARLYQKSVHLERSSSVNIFHQIMVNKKCICVGKQ